MSSPPTNPPKRARRPSRFIEGSPLTRPDLLQRTPTSNELFFNILSEMDEFEKKRKHRGSQSSVGSMNSIPSPIVGKLESRKSFGAERPSLEAERQAQGEEKFSQKFKGRLRALTGGKEGKGV